jgi:hypothetical protein
MNGRHLAGPHLVIVFLHQVAHPVLKNRIAEIGDSIGRVRRSEIHVPAAVRDIRNIGNLHDRPGAAFGRQKIVAGRPVRMPGRMIVRSKIRNRRCGLRLQTEADNSNANCPRAI